MAYLWLVRSCPGKTRPVSCGGSLFGVWKGRVYALVAVLVFACAALSSAAAADPLPQYKGSMSFPEIHGPSDPEDYSWEVQLDEGQELRLVDERNAVVYYADGEHVTSSIRAADAHDAVGKSVPTTLEVSPPDVVTLTVHHRAGNPAAGGAPFTYPILEGSGWEGGFSTFEVIMPPSEPLPASPAVTAGTPCLVPRLRGRPLNLARRRIRSAGCRIGRVRRQWGTASKQDRVMLQSPAPGTSLPPWAPVTVNLGE